MEPCAVYRQFDGVTRIPLQFDPAGSVFVVFRPGPAKVHALSVEYYLEREGSKWPVRGFRRLCELHSDGQRLELQVWKAGNYEVMLPDKNRVDGRPQLVKVASVPAPRAVAGPWTLQFPAGWGAGTDQTRQAHLLVRSPRCRRALFLRHGDLPHDVRRAGRHGHVFTDIPGPRARRDHRRSSVKREVAGHVLETAVPLRRDRSAASRRQRDSK